MAECIAYRVVLAFWVVKEVLVPVPRLLVRLELGWKGEHLERTASKVLGIAESKLPSRWSDLDSRTEGMETLKVRVGYDHHCR